MKWLQKLNRGQLVLLACALLGFAALKGGMIYWYLHQQPAQSGPMMVSCDNLQQGCQLPNGSTLRVDSAPRHSQPFNILIDKAAQAPSAEFSMADMDMGFNRYRFVAANAGWQARVTLPVCVTGSQSWLMDIELDQQRYRIAFKAL